MRHKHLIHHQPFWKNKECMFKFTIPILKLEKRLRLGLKDTVSIALFRPAKCNIAVFIKLVKQQLAVIQKLVTFMLMFLQASFRHTQQ